MSLFADADAMFTESIVKSVVLGGLRGLRHQKIFHQQSY